VSARLASPADRGVLVRDKAPLDKVRALQHTLYRTAKANPGRRFHGLWDKVLRRDVLWRAWVAVRANNGAPGIDRTTLDWIEKEYDIDRLLDELSGELREGSYRPLPARRVYIPKPGTTEQLFAPEHYSNTRFELPPVRVSPPGSHISKAPPGVGFALAGEPATHCRAELARAARPTP
jgi:hypothetical protein